ncbi:MAG: hypothetical protein ACTSPV_14140 [Candidatus Hodarchaeales archaeon]
MSENKNSNNLVIGFGLSLAVLSIFNSLLTLGKELVPPVKDFAIAIGGLVGISHHWVGHGIIIIVLFLILGIVFSQAKVSEFFVQKFSLDESSVLYLIGACVLIGFGIIGGFFFMDAFL